MCVTRQLVKIQASWGCLYSCNVSVSLNVSLTCPLSQDAPTTSGIRDRPQNSWVIARFLIKRGGLGDRSFCCRLRSEILLLFSRFHHGPDTDSPLPKLLKGTVFKFSFLFYSWQLWPTQIGSFSVLGGSHLGMNAGLFPL